MMTRPFVLIFLLPAFIFAAIAEKPAQQSPPFRIEDFELKDQFDNKHKQVFPKDVVSIFALADRKGSDQLEDWITPFYARYESRVDICGVANLKGAPKWVRPMIRSLFRNGIDYPVMMDWSGETCEALGYRERVADIFIVSTNGVVTHRVSGEASEEKLNACFLVLDTLIRAKETGERNPAEKADARQTVQSLPARESTSGAPPQES
jgi:hypothetical protein